MAVVPRKLKSSTVYWIANKWGKQQLWERVGTDRRAAERRDAAMKKEIAVGTYSARKTGAATVGSYAQAWFPKRKGRSAANEESLFKNHVLARAPWYARLKVEDVRVRHTVQLVDDLRETYSGRYGKRMRLSEKSIALIVGVLRTMFRDARIHELTAIDPCELPAGTLRRGTSAPREPYASSEVAILTSDSRVDWDARVWVALAFFTGMREGEVCGRRWRDLDRASLPLQCLTIDSQYDGQPLKTERPRRAPVHPALENILDKWYREGWELFYLRKPRPNDFIVPRRDVPDAAACLTKSMAYKRFLTACRAVEIAPHTVHATRHTFISLARRGGARKEVVERITHNAKGDIVDQYTNWDWGPLCEAVQCLPVLTLASVATKKEPAPA
jgi:integrase